MRVLMLTQFYWPTIGGEERHVQDLSVELVRRGHSVAVATLARPGLPAQEIDQGVRIYRIPSTSQRISRLFTEPDRRHVPPFPDPEATRALHRLVHIEQPDILHAHNWLAYSAFPLKIWGSAPLVVTLHDYSLSCAMKRLMRAGQPCSGPGAAKCLACSMRHYGPLKGLATALAKGSMAGWERREVDLYLAVSQAVAERSLLAERRLPFKVIPNFLPEHLHQGKTQPVEGASPPPPVLPARGYLLFVGDVSREKGVEVLLEAYARLRDETPAGADGEPAVPPLVIIGRKCLDTPQLDRPGVIYLGSQPHAVVMDAFRGCQIALAPSVWPEPFGLVALEAMAAGKPVIAARSGGLAGVVVDGETGCLVPPGDAGALRGAIKSLLADPARARRLGKAAQKRAATFRAGRVVRQIESCYEGLLAAHQPGAAPAGSTELDAHSKS